MIGRLYMFLSILKMVLPVLIMFLLGWLCARKRIFDPQGLTGIKNLVGQVLLVAVLFNAFFTAEYSGRLALTLAVVFLSSALGLGVGFLLRRLVKPCGRFFPFLVTNFEGGMMGYALFGLLYPGQTHVFAMVDIGQTLAAFTVFLTALQAVSAGRADPKSLAKIAFSNPVLIGVLLGILLGVTGVGKWVQSIPAGQIVAETMAFVSAPVSGLILIIVGYELRFRKELLGPVLKTVGLRLLVMAALLGLDYLVIFSIIPFDKQLFIALMLAWSLPAPFIIPLYADLGQDSEYISTSLSAQTVASILLFIGVAAYSLA